MGRGRRSAIAPSSLLYRQLLSNGDAEAAATFGAYPGWVTVSGDWNPRSRDSVVANTKAQNGQAFFFPGICAVGELRQIVSVEPLALLIDRGDLTCSVSAFVQVFRQRPPDSAELKIEYIDQAGTVLSTWSSGKVVCIDHWEKQGHTCDMPVHTRSVVVTLIARRTGPRGSKVNNVYFDNVNLVITNTNESRSTFTPSSGETLAAADSKSAVPGTLPHSPGQTVASDQRPATTITGPDGAGDWQSLFDGKTFNGWRSTGSGKWSVEDGAIVGRKAGSEQGQGQLITDSEFNDFALRMKFKLLGGDSGIYFRGREGGRLGFFGPQVQFRLQDDVGGLIELRQQDDRAIIRIPGPANASQRFFRPNDWNDLELNAKGAHVSVRINGVSTAELDDGVDFSRGKLAIQLWGDKYTEVLIKDILIRPEPQVHDIQVQRPAEPQSPDRAEAARKPNWLTLDERREGWRLLFDGKSLKGWQGSRAHYFVEDGMLFRALVLSRTKTSEMVSCSLRSSMATSFSDSSSDFEAGAE